LKLCSWKVEDGKVGRLKDNLQPSNLLSEKLEKNEPLAKVLILDF
jgi:hypothetical protein